MCGNFIFAVATILHDLDLRFPFSGSMLTLEGASLTVAGGACGVLVGGGSKVPFKCRKSDRVQLVRIVRGAGVCRMQCKYSFCPNRECLFPLSLFATESLLKR